MYINYQICLDNVQRANGINIDEVFRNENGIALQMTKMDYLLTDGKKDYRELVVIYSKWQMSKLNSDRFEKNPHTTQKNK